MELGIVGLPASGKTTVFNALSRSRVPVATFSAPSAGAEPNRAVVKVPDDRLAVLARMFNPLKVTPAEVRYVDVAGVVQGSGRESSGAAVLAPLRQTDALLVVLRAFADPSVLHPEGSVDPSRDLELVATELLISDLEIVERRIERLTKSTRSGKAPEAERVLRERELALLEPIRECVAAGKPARLADVPAGDGKLIRGFGLLSLKPWLIVLNVDEQGAAEPVPGLGHYASSPDTEVAVLAGRLEMELLDLDPDEAGEFRESLGLTTPGLDLAIQASYRLLRLISFFTVGEDEVRAWPVPAGASAVDAASVIHTDISRGFIRAEVVPYEQLVEAGGLVEARRRGWLRSEGRTYAIKDGDIAHFLHSG